MKQFIISLKFLVVMTVLTGVIYPLVVYFIGDVLFHDKAMGSMIVKNDKVVGSELIAQQFTQEKYFWPRPSAVDYNPIPSGGSNLGPTSADLAAKVKERAAKGLSAEMLFASGSGLDPHIYPATAIAQADRVSKARNFNPEQKQKLFKLIENYTEGRQFGILGESRVNVLKLNIALDEGAY